MTALSGVAGERVRFTVPGVPVAAARPRMTTVGGFARAYSPKSNVEYAELVRLAFEREHPGFVPVGRGVPIMLEATFRFPRPKSHFGTGKNADRLKVTAPRWHVVKPDVDNLLKLVKDALKGVAWHDDSQVCAYGDVLKLYVDSFCPVPGTAIVLEALEPVE